MAHALRHNEALARRKINHPIFQIDQEAPVQHEKEFIDVFVLMPMILALHHSHPDNRIVHLAKGLVVPFVGASIGQLLHIDYLKRPLQNVQLGFVGKVLRGFIRVHDLSLNAETAERTHLACGVRHRVEHDLLRRDATRRTLEACAPDYSSPSK